MDRTPTDGYCVTGLDSIYGVRNSEYCGPDGATENIAYEYEINFNTVTPATYTFTILADYSAGTMFLVDGVIIKDEAQINSTLPFEFSVWLSEGEHTITNYGATTSDENED